MSNSSNKTILFLCLIAIIVLEFLSSRVNGTATFSLSFIKTIPYFLVFSTVWFLSSLVSTNCVERILLFGASGYLLYEAITGFLQLFGLLTPNHSLFLITGDFPNPGPCGGLLAILISICFTASCCIYSKLLSSGDKLLLLISGFSSLLGIIILPSTLSRTAIISLSAAILCWLVYEKKLYRFVFRKEFILPAIAISCFLLYFCFFRFKNESAAGRLFIWKIEVNAIIKEPLSGYGPGCAMGAFGKAQEAHFRMRGADSADVSIAGVPDFPFNEYLRFGMESGVVGLVLALLVLGLCVEILYGRRSSLTYGAIALGVFAMASYPFALWQFRVVLAVMLGYALSSRSKIVKSLSGVSILASVALTISFSGELQSISKADALMRECHYYESYSIEDIPSDSLAAFLPYMKDNPHFLYEYARLLSQEGNLEESNSILEKGMLVSADPMFNIQRGINFEKLGDLDYAEKEYQSAIFKVPCRIYARFCLMLLKLRAGESADALGIAEDILKMDINPKVYQMVEYRHRTEIIRDSLRLKFESIVENDLVMLE